MHYCVMFSRRQICIRLKKIVPKNAQSWKHPFALLLQLFWILKSVYDYWFISKSYTWYTWTRCRKRRIQRILFEQFDANRTECVAIEMWIWMQYFVFWEINQSISLKKNCIVLLDLTKIFKYFLPFTTRMPKIWLY